MSVGVDSASPAAATCSGDAAARWGASARCSDAAAAPTLGGAAARGWVGDVVDGLAGLTGMTATGPVATGGAARAGVGSAPVIHRPCSAAAGRGGPPGGDDAGASAWINPQWPHSTAANAASAPPGRQRRGVGSAANLGSAVL